MPVKFVKIARYLLPNGQEFDQLSDAQEAELAGLMPVEWDTGDQKAAVAMWAVANRDKIMSILRQKERKHATAPAKPTSKKRGRPTGTPAEPPKV